MWCHPISFVIICLALWFYLDWAFSSSVPLVEEIVGKEFSTEEKFFYITEDY
jgi:hypothetical protein